MLSCAASCLLWHVNLHLVNLLEGCTFFFFQHYNEMKTIILIPLICLYHFCNVFAGLHLLCLRAARKSIVAQTRSCFLPSWCCYFLFVIHDTTEGALRGCCCWNVLFLPHYVPPLTYTCRNKTSENNWKKMCSRHIHKSKDESQSCSAVWLTTICRKTDELSMVFTFYFPF